MGALFKFRVESTVSFPPALTQEEVYGSGSALEVSKLSKPHFAPWQTNGIVYTIRRLPIVSLFLAHIICLINES